MNSKISLQGNLHYYSKNILNKVLIFEYTRRCASCGHISKMKLIRMSRGMSFLDTTHVVLTATNPQTNYYRPLSFELIS